MTGRDEKRRYQANYRKEIDGAAMYTALAQAETKPQLAEVYRRLAETERQHASFWEQKLQAAGLPVPGGAPGWRTRVLARLAKWFGPKTVLPTIASNEEADRAAYAGQADAVSAGLSGDEQSHARLLRAVSEGTSPGLSGSAVARLEGRHRAIGGNALRAAVLGANDGLVSNLSLVMGVAGAAAAAGADHMILITGLAGLLAGACSMAMGEWLSVQSSRELYQRQIGLEKQELIDTPAEEEEELSLIYQAKGLPEAQAKSLAASLIADPASALDTLSREELGIDPKELGGSAWEAAGMSFVLFAIGAIIPVLPFFFLHAMTAVLTSVAVSAVGLVVIGAGITLMTGRSVLFSGARQLLFGLGAAAITYTIGHLVGVAISG